MKYLCALLLLAPLAAAQRAGSIVFHRETVGGFAFDVGNWDGVGGIEFGVILDPSGGVTLTLAGDALATGTAAILDGLPGGAEAATAGSTGCWSVPGPLSGNELIPVTGHGDTLGAAVEDYKQQIDELEALGFTPAPSGDCDPKVDPQAPEGLGPVFGPGHP